MNTTLLLLIGALVLIGISIAIVAHSVRRPKPTDEHESNFDSIGTFHSEPDAPFWDKLS
jgi:hypothetical protein